LQKVNAWGLYNRRWLVAHPGCYHLPQSQLGENLQSLSPGPSTDLSNAAVKASPEQTKRLSHLVQALTRGGPAIPGGCLIAKEGCEHHTKPKLSHAANDTTGEVKEHELGKSVRGTRNQGLDFKWSALVVGQLFTIALS